MGLADTAVSPGLQRAVVDLEHYLHELSTDQQTDKNPRKSSKKPANPPRTTSDRHDRHKMLEDPLIPWLRVAMGALALAAVGSGWMMIQQLSGLYM